MLSEHESVVAKFGGTSMAQPSHVVQLLTAHYDPIAVVVSAPGQDVANRTQPKMTDLLYEYEAHSSSANRVRVLKRLSEVAHRYPIESELGLLQQAEHDLEERRITRSPLAALGEQWSAQLLAAATGRTYIDAARVVVINDHHTVDIDATVARVQSLVLGSDRVVIPGFYGQNYKGEIATLARGGSDITGAVVALALEAHYHNWTDVNGFYDQDPRYNSDAVLLKNLTYSEALSIAQTGVELLHEHAIKLLSLSGLATVIRNTFDAAGSCSVISSDT